MPREVRAALCLLTLWLPLSALVMGQGAAVQPGSAWNQFRGSPRLTGVSASVLPSTLKLLWTFEVGEAIDSSAAIADGIVYVGSANGDLVAVDLESGKLRWKYSTHGSIGESSPAVGRDAVFIGDLAGVVHAVRSRDGSGLWTFKTGGEVKSSPTIADDLVLIGSYDGHLYALEAATGKLRWKVATEGPVHATPAVQNGIVYTTGCDENFRAVRLTDGKELFRIPEGGNTGASPLIDGERGYFGTFNSEVLGIDLRAKTVLWRYRDAERQFPYYSSAALAQGRIIVGGRDKRIRAIDAATGKAAWTFTARARVDSSPAVAGGRAYVGSSDGHLYVLDVVTGQKHWEFDAGAPIVASPAIARGRVVIGDQDGRLYCFG